MCTSNFIVLCTFKCCNVSSTSPHAQEIVFILFCLPDDNCMCFRIDENQKNAIENINKLLIELENVHSSLWQDSNDGVMDWKKKIAITECEKI